MFNAVVVGDKDWEFRRDDRGFMVGDTLRLEYWDPAPDAITGRSNGYFMDQPPTRLHCLRRVTLILHGGRFGVPEGFCVMSLSPDLEPTS